jgi:SAM-dependent methyltransferase
MTGVDNDMHARAAYDVFAGFYDAFTAHHDHDGWTRTLEQLAVDAGLSGKRLLDVACGTGRSLVPMAARGYDVVGCDVSPRMVAVARERAGGLARVHVHDMRQLPELGEFDLIWCLGDALNYLSDEAELRAVFRGVVRNLEPEGVFVCDVNTLATFRELYSSLLVQVHDDSVVVLEGHGSPTLAPGGSATVWIDCLRRSRDVSWTRERSVHHHRHHPAERLRSSCAAAGLDRIALYGTQPTGEVERGPDERRHAKVVLVARRARA